MSVSSAPGAIARERGQLIAGEGDFFLVDIDLTLVFGQRRFRLTQFELCAYAAFSDVRRARSATRCCCCSSVCCAISSSANA